MWPFWCKTLASLTLYVDMFIVHSWICNVNIHATSEHHFIWFLLYLLSIILLLVHLPTIYSIYFVAFSCRSLWHYNKYIHSPFTLPVLIQCLLQGSCLFSIFNFFFSSNFSSFIYRKICSIIPWNGMNLNGNMCLTELRVVQSCC